MTTMFKDLKGRVCEAKKFLVTKIINDKVRGEMFWNWPVLMVNPPMVMVPTKMSELKVKPGQWIVICDNEPVGVYTDETFKTHYTPVKAPKKSKP